MELGAFYQVFFDETEELLDEMEQKLLHLNIDTADSEALNAIFRCAHSVKGGAATFGFSQLQKTTHILENVLDGLRSQTILLTADILQALLNAKDILLAQLNAYRNEQLPDEYLFSQVEALFYTLIPTSDKSVVEAVTAKTAAETYFSIKLVDLKPHEITLLLDELNILGTVIEHQIEQTTLTVLLQTAESQQDITAVLCFLLDEQQIHFSIANPIAEEVSQHNQLIDENKQLTTVDKTATKTIAAIESNRSFTPSEASTIRVAVEKVDQLINLVGELIITQSMLMQHSQQLDDRHNPLHDCLNQLARNSRDLQLSVMSIRMMPMDYVFNRFPRLVHDLAIKLNKKVSLTLKGKTTELDKGLIEKIIDPLTHLVRNSLDHGIELPEVRRQRGKAEEGQLMISAEHQGGNICITVSDDDNGLNREKILQKARSIGLEISDQMSDQDIAMLIFAPGFSTAESVTDVSGRGVGMDIVKQNIHEMGGQITLTFEAGKGTTTHIFLPLTLAILEAMSVQVSDEIFILPLNAVVSVLQPKAEQIFMLGNNEKLLLVWDEYIPLIELYQVLDIPQGKKAINEGIVVIVQYAGKKYALFVDSLLGQQQVVVKNIETNFKPIKGITSATIMGDGSVALILDIKELYQLAYIKRQQ
ncbi:chemotaxis protein CheA [Arsenophonus nasoniae]|uniref:Chemotaxis protein CheA n=1 Tax=Arsenophonus nasoniae TaxID=638 RepID=D2TYI6_9GAMM|nr:chemotaxis protein CheA [Arsenophonus nasoniae]QBY42900.1 Chemotaxis protein CheA [Arsenophonus nasoniae]WGM06959.1 chemotaxis protein CheA [Arsenophonus nasoniae]WGM11840.1 chemotaxis protein CheA [Arsenophonus nasoniae]WGM16525.1 chemotaxis protein CheA [Arsenophonus nasoniae]CBA72481.1 two-component system, chemotaxis family, sensor kinase CheA [Arsenophonus nasoniae]